MTKAQIERYNYIVKRLWELADAVSEASALEAELSELISIEKWERDTGRKR